MTTREPDRAGRGDVRAPRLRAPAGGGTQHDLVGRASQRQARWAAQAVDRLVRRRPDRHASGAWCRRPAIQKRQSRPSV